MTQRYLTCVSCLKSLKDAPAGAKTCSVECRRRNKRQRYKASRLRRGLPGSVRPERVDHADPDCTGSTRCWCWHKRKFGGDFSEVR